MTIEVLLAGKLEQFMVPDRQRLNQPISAQGGESIRPNPSHDVPEPWDVPTARV
jgi:hypothetical protein